MGRKLDKKRKLKRAAATCKSIDGFVTKKPKNAMVEQKSTESRTGTKSNSEPKLSTPHQSTRKDQAVENVGANISPGLTGKFLKLLL